MNSCKKNQEVLRISIYLFIYLDIQRHPHLHDSGFSVEVKDDRAKKYYCKEKDKDQEGCD